MRPRISRITIRATQVTKNKKVVNLRPTFHQLFSQLTSDEQLAFRMRCAGLTS